MFNILLNVDFFTFTQIPFENSPRNSSDGSDQELRKIHADHRETETKGDAFFINTNGEMVNRPDSLKINRPNSAKVGPAAATASGVSAPKTSFAQLQREKSHDNGGNQSNMAQSKDGTQRSMNVSLKDQYDRSKTQQSQQKPATTKKATFAALPNQTTWSEFTFKKRPEMTSSTGSEPEQEVTPQAEMINIRMMLGESRRKIEEDKRKNEVQVNKQRQRVGKQAFMQVCRGLIDHFMIYPIKVS